MPAELLTFNAFGLVKATNNEVVVTVTAITSTGKTIKRVLSLEHEAPLDIFEPGEHSSATFAALIDQSTRSRIVYNDLIAHPGVPEVGDIPGVSAAVAKAIKQIKQAL